MIRLIIDLTPTNETSDLVPKWIHRLMSDIMAGIAAIERMCLAENGHGRRRFLGERLDSPPSALELRLVWHGRRYCCQPWIASRTNSRVTFG